MGEIMKNFIETVTSRSDMITEAFLQHIFLSFVALAVGILIALPAGMLVARHRRFAEPIIGVAAILQTIPSLALFGFLVPLIGIGSKTALIALIIYALLPIVRNTYAGLTGVDEVDYRSWTWNGDDPESNIEENRVSDCLACHYGRDSDSDCADGRYCDACNVRRGRRAGRCHLQRVAIV